MIEELKEIYAQRYALARERKNQGSRIIGWLCTYFPEEVYLAAGLETFRVLGGAEETPMGDAYLYSNLCTFVRNCMEEGFRGNYDFLSGFVTCNTCEHIRRLYDVWKRYIGTPYTYIFSLPCKASEQTVAFFKDELLKIREDLEQTFKVRIIDEGLRQAIQLQNRTRGLLRRLYDLRRSPTPPIKGSEVMEVVRVGMVLPKAEYHLRLEWLLERLESGKNGSLSPLSEKESGGRGQSSADPRPPTPVSSSGPRLMILGSELDDPGYLQEIEEVGGVVVVDDLCCGSRYFWDPVEEGEEAGDPWEALAHRYLYRSQCPRMHPAQKRLAHLQELAERFHVQGVIYQTLKFCGPHAGMYPVIKNAFDRMGIPVLRLEREYIASARGQLKTRVQALFESL